MTARAGPQYDLFNQLRPIAEVIAERTVDGAYRFFQEVRETGLEWVYRSGGVGRLINRHGYVLIEDGDLGSAEKAFLVNTLLYPDDGGVWDSLGECRFHQERWNEAEACYLKSIEKNPRNMNARTMLTRIAKLRSQETDPEAAETP